MILFQQISPIPPPVPARQNKAPAIPERRNIKKLEQTTPTTPNNGIITTTEPATATASIAVKLPPPPQSTSKRGSFSRTNPAEPKELENCDQKSNQRTDSHPKPQNGAFTEIKTLTPLQNAALFNNLRSESTDESYFKFPRVQTSPSSNPEDPNYETFSSIRRKSGKKIPPPIHTYTNQVIDDAASPNFGSISKMSVRHDSTLSCSDGGISQTSSPSYLIRSLESPLLPKVKSHSTNRHSKRKFIPDKLFSDINEFAMPKDNKILSPPDLTKSQSTPAGLQTVVDYQQGANLPYQHKVSSKISQI